MHTGSTSAFIGPVSGLYIIDYELLVDNTSLLALASTISARILRNNTEIAGSQESVSLGALLLQRMQLARLFITSLSPLDSIKLQFAGTSTNNQTTANNGLGTTRPSATITITPL